MYGNFFGFKERPFKLLPDPTYLFLSKGHEEALAHLNYAVDHGDGFVEITGEVGTGKTTLCRVFLDRLPDDTEAAYIFNPRLDEVQLLRAINDELHVDASADNAKELVDALNAFLMEMKAAGKKVIVIIDEAQNLSVDVLEQLRLLSNLETTRSKLIQIILVGQPELAEMLDSRELRQLGQRVTLSCYLAPLTFKETKAYVDHRLQVARTKPGSLFSKNALKEIYKHTGGVPRLINIICDRSLLIAFSRNRQRVSGSIVRTAIRELWSRGDHRRRFPLVRGKIAAALAAVAIVVVVLLLPSIVHREPEAPPPTAWPIAKQESEDPSATAAVSPAPHVDTEAVPPAQALEPPEPAPVSEAPPMPLKAYLEQAEPAETRFNAMTELLALWSVKDDIQPYLVSIKDDDTFFNLAAEQQGLRIEVVDGNPDLVRKLNLPAIFRFGGTDEKPPIYLTLEKIQDGQAIFRAQGTASAAAIAYDALVSQFKGSVIIAWRNHLGFKGTIPLSHPKGSVIMLKMLLRDLGYDEVALTPEYDKRTRTVIENIQHKNGIRADGFVGPMTKIVLYNEKGDFPGPRLVEYEPL